MKKILISLCMCVFASSVQAQFIKQGSIIGGGSFDFHTEKVKDSNSKGSSFNLIPFAGYLVMDNLVVGANLEYGLPMLNQEVPQTLPSKAIRSCLVRSFVITWIRGYLFTGNIISVARRIPIILEPEKPPISIVSHKSG